MTAENITTWTIVTDVAALWGVAEGDDRDGALEDALDWCRDFNAAAPDVSVNVYRVATSDEDVDLSVNFCRSFALPDSLMAALAGAPGLVRVRRAN
jgi:chlorite dismutase